MSSSVLHKEAIRARGVHADQPAPPPAAAAQRRRSDPVAPAPAHADATSSLADEFRRKRAAKGNIHATQGATHAAAAAASLPVGKKTQAGEPSKLAAQWRQKRRQQRDESDDDDDESECGEQDEEEDDSDDQEDSSTDVEVATGTNPSALANERRQQLQRQKEKEKKQQRQQQQLKQQLGLQQQQEKEQQLKSKEKEKQQLMQKAEEKHQKQRKNEQQKETEKQQQKLQKESVAVEGANGDNHGKHVCRIRLHHAPTLGGDFDGGNNPSPSDNEPADTKLPENDGDAEAASLPNGKSNTKEPRQQPKQQRKWKRHATWVKWSAVLAVLLIVVLVALLLSSRRPTSPPHFLALDAPVADSPAAMPLQARASAHVTSIHTATEPPVHTLTEYIVGWWFRVADVVQGWVATLESV